MRFQPALILVFPAFLLGLSAMAQQGTSVEFDPQHGVLIKHDSTFVMNFRFLMQDRASFYHTAGAGAQENTSQFQVRRFRLKLEGYALTPRLEYKIQLGLSAQDMNIGDGHSAPNAVLDALVFYKLASHTKIGFGQGKLQGGRQAIISSSELELPERPLANSAFTLDRDIGLFLAQDMAIGQQHLHLYGSVSQGEGRATGGTDVGLCYTGRLEWLPLGEFSNKSDHMEGDLYQEAKPKLSLATAYSTDRNARRARAQSGPRFPDDQGCTIGTFFIDALFKHNGWSWQSEYNQRSTDGSPAVQDTTTGTFTRVNVGMGFTSQLSKMIGERSQVAARYSMVRYDSRVKDQYSDRDEGTLGYSYYLNGHRVKLQSALTYNWLNGEVDTKQPGNQWALLFQVELGI
ncbi:MAG: porin [Flavobacteriales bacterium]